MNTSPTSHPQTDRSAEGFYECRALLWHIKYTFTWCKMLMTDFSVRENRRKSPISFKPKFHPQNFWWCFFFRSGPTFLHFRFTVLVQYKPDILQTKVHLPVLLCLYLLVFKLFCACVRCTYFIQTFFFPSSRSLQTLVQSF